MESTFSKGPLIPDVDVNHKLHSLLAGDSEAAAWLYDTFATSLFSRLRRRYRELDPEDLLHDAFVFFFQNNCKVLRDFVDRVAPDDQNETTLDRHLWNLACGVACNNRRSAARRRSVPLAEFDNPSPQPGAELTVIGRDLLERLDACLQTNGTRLYLYFRLRYGEGLTPEEIAQATGWSRKAVYKLRQTLTSAASACAEKLGIELHTADRRTER